MLNGRTSKSKLQPKTVPVSNRWRPKGDEFGTLGLKDVKGGCSFCPESFTGSRDEVIEWFKSHMQEEHPDILEVQASIPKVKRRKAKKFSYRSVPENA